jgi:hypothetical protein
MTRPNTLAVLRAEKHISISAINCYLMCPRQYEHRYILCTPPRLIVLAPWLSVVPFMPP